MIALAAGCARAELSEDAAEALTIEGDTCVLSRSPFLLPLAMPAGLDCAADQDGNGLDDEIERELARCVVPRIKFDDAENALEGGEPKVLFSAYHQGPMGIRFEFAYLFRSDGGPATSSGFCAMDTHDGDCQGLGLTVAVARGLRWTAKPGPVELEGVPTAIVGTHPVVYASAGKHHWYVAPGDYEYGADCDDRANGLGVDVIPGTTGGSLGHVPSIRSQLGALTPLGPSLPGNVWANGCTLARTGKPVAATGFQGNDLADLGFDGQTVLGAHFYSGGVSGVAATLSGGFTPDADGDGLADAIHRDDVGQLHLPQDRCPTVAGGGADLDGDGVGDDCDPEPSFRNRYVAGGDASHPAYAGGVYQGPWFNDDGQPGGPREGWLDTDRDGWVDGEDSCPASAGPPSSDLNRWAEDWNQTVDLAHAALYRDRGRFVRGDDCDPYPAVTAHWDQDVVEGDTLGGSCSLLRKTIGGAHSLPIRLFVRRGLSENDPLRDANPIVVGPASFRVQAYRCACVGYAGKACLEDPASACYQGSPSRATAATPVGRGWRPIHRAGCALDAEGWCSPTVVVVPPFTSVPVAMSWDWRDELTKLPGHFAGDDFETVSVSSSLPPETTTHLASTHAYALWVQVEEGLDFSAAPGPQPFGVGSHSGLYVDPEQTDAMLLDVGSTRSRRLRASFGLPAPVSEPWSSTSIGTLCTFASKIRALDVLDLPNPSPEAIGVDDVRALAAAGPTLAEHWLVAPSLGRARALRVGAGGPGWLSTSTGLAALLAPPLGEKAPAVLWVETGVRSSRFAVLEPVVGRGGLEYRVAGEGLFGGAVSASARIVPEPRGQSAAIVDLAAGTARLFDPVARSFLARGLPRGVIGREGAGLALSGVTLWVLGGTGRAGWSADAWAIDLARGAASQSRVDVPVRAFGHASVSPDGRTLLLLGGVDAGGVMHDDVSTFAIDGPGRLSASRRATADRLAPAGYSPAAAAIVSSTRGLLQVAVDPGATELFKVRTL